jgi:RNA polymerase sigma-70 factor, ECF subfamily
VTERLPTCKVESPGNEGPLPSFPEVYDRYQALVRRCLFKLLGARDLDDVVQEAFLRIWKGLPKFDGRSLLKTWIYAVTVRAGIDHLRKVGRRGFLTPLDPAATFPSNEEMDHLHKDLVSRGLGALSEEHRVVLILAIYEGLSLAEIAEVTSTNEGTVKSRLHYARKGMCEFLEKNGVSV